MRGVNATAYVRIPFTSPDPSLFDALTLRMRYDDGFIAYLNGVEVARANAGGSLAYDSAATAARDGYPTAAQSFNLTPYLGLLHAGTNLLAIRGLNASAGDDDFLALPELIGSSARADRPGYFAEPTPGGPNGQAYAGVVAQASASVGRGFYTSPFSLSLGTPTSGATIRYTLDGSEPTATHGLTYSGPLTISSTTTLRFGAFAAGWLSSPTVAETYLFLDDVVRQSADGSAPAGWPTGPVSGQVLDYGMDPSIVDGPTYGPLLQAALKAVPTISITTDLANLLDPTTGIYVNGYMSGREWERPGSVELINPDGSAGFQIGAGLRIRGSYSGSGENPKHSLRLFFRGEYGASSLDYPMFGSEGVDSFEKLDLRTAQNYSWSFEGDPNNNFIAEVFARDTMRDLGQPYTRSRFYQLYINGQYWGLYQSEERPDADFAASYFGGDSDDYDVVKTESGPYNIEATDGDLDAWTRLWDAVAGPDKLDLSKNAAYYQLQGKNPDGSANPDYEALVDVDNLIDYMMVIFYSGNLDGPISAKLNNQAPNNFFAIRDRTGNGGGFKFIMRDAEHSLLDVNESRIGPYQLGDLFAKFNPQYLHQQLMANAEYRLRFADHVRKALGPGGALSPEVAQARFRSEADQIALAIVAESARWGDAQRPGSPLTQADWQAAVDRVLYDYMPYRTAIVWDQLRAAGLYPAIEAPTFLVDGVASAGGPVQAGAGLTMIAPGGTLYYTTDGTDPRLADGSISPLAIAYAGSPLPLSRTTPLTARALVGGSWSAAASARFTVDVPAAAGNLAITEINYNPAAGPEASDKQLFEFVELRNVGTSEIDLTGVRFTAGITFDFTGSAIATLAPGAYVVIVKDAAAFAARYGAGRPVAGAYDGSLSNSGETLTLVDAGGATIESFAYGVKKPWPKTPDGDGATLVRIDPLAPPDSVDNWRAGAVTNGTPGNPDTNAPTISDLEDRRILEGSPLDLPFTVGDVETPAGSLAVTVSADNLVLLPPGALTLGGSDGSRTLRIAPPPDAYGSATITITVVDADGAVARRSFRLTVAFGNAPPALAALPDRAAREGEALVFTVAATDPDAGQSITYSLDDGHPAGATIDPATGVFSWTPGELDGGGVFTITVRATDSGTPSKSSAATFAIAVEEVDQPPVLAPIPDRTVAEHATLIFRASATDADLPAQSLVYTLAAGAPAGARITPGGGVFSWTPDESQGGRTYTITILATGSSSPAITAWRTFRVTVAEVDDPPVLPDLPDRTIDAGAFLGFSAAASDPDTPPGSLTYALAAGTDLGATLATDTGWFAWTPSASLAPGVYTFTIVASDAGGASDSATFAVRVTPQADRPPVVTPVADATVRAGEVAGLVVSATDPEGRAVAYALAPGAPAGAAIDPNTGAFSWPTPAGLAAGRYAFTVLASDGALTTAATFGVVVVAAPAPPRTIDLGPSASIVAGGSLYVAARVPAGAVAPFVGTVDYGDGAGAVPLAVAADGSFALAHAYATAGSYAVAVRVVDAAGASAAGSLAVAVSAAPAVQVASQSFASSVRGTTIALAFSGPLAPAEAGDANRYFVILAGPDGKFGTRDDRRLSPTAASYDAGGRVVTITSRARIPAAMKFRISIADGSLRDASGRPIDGDRDGRAGGGFTVDLGGRPPRQPIRRTAFPARR